jgi:hypothetical protein
MSGRFGVGGGVLARRVIATADVAALSTPAQVKPPMRIVGSCHDAGTRRLLEFATRNRLPHRWIDLEKDPDVDAFLRRMHVDRSDTPVVILRTGKLRNPPNSEVAAELGILVSPQPRRRR